MPRTASVGRERIDNYLKVFCTAELAPRKNIVTKKIAEQHPDWLARLIDEQDARLQADRARTRARRARAHPRARHHRGGRDHPLRARKRTPRAARLRRPDRQDARPVRTLVGRLGALQARPRHRPRADRRGAGHQPEAMGDRAHHRLRIHARRRAAQCEAHDVRGRRREAVDLLVPGRGAARLRRDAARIRRAIRHARTRAGATCASTTRSAPARPCSAASTGCLPRARFLRQRHHRRSRRAAAHVAARRRARAGRTLAADRAGRAQGNRRLGRAVRHRERAKPARRAGASGSRRTSNSGWRAGRSPATCWCWCASAGRCSRRSSAR